MSMNKNNVTVDDVKNYYGKVLTKSCDLKTEACNTRLQKPKSHVCGILAQVHEEVTSRYYGCGVTLPDCLGGLHVLDLGCGTGRDCFVASKLVGESGFVTGVDMTEELIQIAEKYASYHQKAFGFEKNNTKYVLGYVEDLKACGVEDESVDVVIANCVVNLCKDKGLVLREACRVLRPGGEMHFSDIYVDRKLPECIKCNPELWGEGFAGALYWKDFSDLAISIGFEKPRIVAAKVFGISNSDFQELLGETKYASATVRLVKSSHMMAQMSTRMPMSVSYKGTVPYCETELKFDHDHTFETSKNVLVDEDTAYVLQTTRFSRHFDFSDAPKDHYNTTLEDDPLAIAYGEDKSCAA